MLRPMLLFAVVIAIIANFQVFDTVYVLTQGGPYESTSTIVWFIWKRLFQFQQTGQGYAAAVLLLGIILVLTAISFWLLGSRRRHERETLMAAPGATVDERRRGAAARGLRARRPPEPRRSASARASRAYLVLAVFALIAVGPFLYLLSPSLRQSYELFTYPPEWIPRHALLGQLRHRPARDELPALGAQHADLRDLGDADHAGDRHARGLRLRAASLPGPDGALRARASRR